MAEIETTVQRYRVKWGNIVFSNILHGIRGSDEELEIHMRVCFRDIRGSCEYVVAFVVIYLLSEGYVIPVCVRVIQIFTVTERVSG